MEKYGVDEDKQPTTKQAGAQETCPLCGQVVRTHGVIRLCPTHGSKPFETNKSE
jgi:hypothetical protein